MARTAQQEYDTTKNAWRMYLRDAARHREMAADADKEADRHYQFMQQLAKDHPEIDHA